MNGVVAVIQFLRGKKTYIIAAGAILTSLGAWLGDQIGTNEFVISVFAALGLGTLRAGVTKSGAVSLLLASCLLAPSIAVAQTNTAASATVTINKQTAVEFISFLGAWKEITTLDSFGKAFSTNITLQAVYTFSTEGGLSSGGAAIAAPLVDMTFSIDDNVNWGLHFGPAFVAGSDDTGVFTAMEAAMWTDKFGPLLDLGRKAWKPLELVPKQVDALYLYVGAGVETCGNLDAGHVTCVSFGCGYKF